MDEIDFTDAKLGTKIMIVRKNQGLSQEDLAHRIGIAPATLSRWENNKRPQTLALFSYFLKLMAILGLKKEDLLE